MSGIVSWVESELATLPVVSFTTVKLALLDIASFALVVSLCFLHNTHEATAALEIWFAFLAALHGVNLGAFHFATKSESTSASGQELTPPGAARKMARRRR